MISPNYIIVDQACNNLHTITLPTLVDTRDSVDTYSNPKPKDIRGQHVGDTYGDHYLLTSKEV